MYMHQERINRSNMDWCSKLATNQCYTTFKSQSTMLMTSYQAVLEDMTNKPKKFTSH